MSFSAGRETPPPFSAPLFAAPFIRRPHAQIRHSLVPEIETAVRAVRPDQKFGDQLSSSYSPQCKCGRCMGAQRAVSARRVTTGVTRNSGGGGCTNIQVKPSLPIPYLSPLPIPPYPFTSFPSFLFLSFLFQTLSFAFPPSPPPSINQSCILEWSK